MLRGKLRMGIAPAPRKSLKHNIMNEISLAPQMLFHIGGFPVTNTFVWTLALSFVFFAFSFYIKKSAKLSPGRLQNFFEYVVEAAYDFTLSIIGDEKKAKIPIVAITGNAMNYSLEEFKQAGIDDYLQKPLNFDKLVETVKNLTN